MINDEEKDQEQAPGRQTLRPRREMELNPVAGPHQLRHEPTGTPSRAPLNLWTALDFLIWRWHWLVVGVLVGGATFYALAFYFVRPKFTAVAELLRYEPLGKNDYARSTPLSGDTFAALIRAPELVRSVGEQLVPPLTAETLNKCIKVDADPDSDVVRVYLAAREAHDAVNWLNTYVTDAVEYTRALDSKDLKALADGYLKKEVDEIDRDVTEVEKQFLNLPDGPTATNKAVQVNGRLNALRQRMQKAVTDLDELRTKYTEIHPKVEAQKEAIDLLQREMAGAATNQSPSPITAWTPPTATTGPETANPELDVLHIKLRSLEDGRFELLKRLREAQLYAVNTPSTVRVLAPASLATVKSNHRRLKLLIAPMFGAALGLTASILLALLVEFFDNRLKNAEDLARVTQLPVIASLGNLHDMRPEDRAQWAFRAWTMLQGRLSPTVNHGLICGITSSTPGEGRSTWISLLAEAASLTGYRVLTIATRPSPTHVNAEEELLEDAAPEEREPAFAGGNGSALTTSVLATPGQVTEQLTGPNSQPVVHIPLPGWVWNLERRKQWREALDQWRQVENLVILVELPPASVPEAVLLGSNLPNLIWLADSGAPEAAETRKQLETLRYARCNLVGTVLNRLCSTPLRRRFPRWLGCLLILGFLIPIGTNAQTATNQVAPNPAQPQPTDPAAQERQPGSFSIINPNQRAQWQRRLTLGPGDVVNLDLYGQPELSLKEVTIAPDGRIGYLEATNVVASGLTVDELRAQLDRELAKFRRAPHSMITPVSFKSKKYFVLGKVATKGVFTLDRPLTVLEALARAHGIEAALVDRHLVELADFQHSFLARGGKRFPLNFERLFAQGDLAQNIAVEPGDYIYIAPGDVKEVYVVGEVRLPGPVVYTPNLTIISAIAQRGGYTERAFKARVLVIRGSLNASGATIVNTHAILDAAAPNFVLQPKDIIYVNSRPFIKVEEALDLAATAFIQSVITSYVGVDVVQPLNTF